MAGLSDRTLTLLGEKILQTAINPEFVRYCPTMDLLAVATVDDHVHVYRFNGQEVFAVTSKQQARVQQVMWKPNGQSLAVAFSNHIMILANVSTGKVMHQLDCSIQSRFPFSCLGWGVNFTDIAAVRKRVEMSSEAVGLDDLLRNRSDGKILHETPDLPADLAFLDVDSCLPKLSTLVSSGGDEDVFSSRVSLDALFQAMEKGSNDNADVLVTGYADGTLHLSVHDFFDIGNFSTQHDAHLPVDSKVIRHASHPYSTTHALLVSTLIGAVQRLQFLPLDLRLVSSAGRYLSLLTSKSTQLHNILRYVGQVQKQVYADFKSSQDLPRRFIANLDEALAESHDCTWTQAAFHLLATGHCFGPVREWLSQDIGERNYKRWDKAVTTGYETVRRLIHECLLPALLRMTVLISRLRGLSKFQGLNMALGLSTQELDDVLDTNQTLQLLSHHILHLTNTEFRQYLAFSAWFHKEIEVQSSDSGSSALHDSLERDSSIDHAATLQYIQGAMCQSRLHGHLQEGSASGASSKWNLSAETRSLYELYGSELGNSEAASGKSLPGLDSLIAHMSSQCEKLFSRIAQTQRRNVRFGNTVAIVSGAIRFAEVRIMPGLDTKDEFSVYVMSVVAQDEAQVQLDHFIIKVENGVSTTTTHRRASLDFAGQILQDIKFVDDDSLLVALVKRPNSRLLSLPYRGSNSPFNYQDITDNKDPAFVPDVRTISQDAMEGLVAHTFATGPSEGVERCEVNGRTGRRAVCVVAEDKIRYRIFDIDSEKAVQEEESDAMPDVET